MKKSTKIMVIAIMVIMILAVSSTALAAGSYLSHSGTASYGYTTSDYVSQMNDTTLTCNYGSTSQGVVMVSARFGSDQISSAKTFTGTVLQVPMYSSVRHVKLYLANDWQWQGTSITTQGNWTLSA
ncbi:MAG: hypothetical protein RR234_04745 [Christensenella sp.]